MNSSRQDAWTTSEDKFLADTILRYIKEGGTQLEAFKEVAEQLKRTPAACGFRWNANIRKIYEDQVEQAKRQRKDAVNIVDASQLDSHSIDSAISILESLKRREDNSEELQNKLLFAELKEENQQLERLIKQYEAIWQQMSEQIKLVQEASRIVPNTSEKTYT